MPAALAPGFTQCFLAYLCQASLLYFRQAGYFQAQLTGNSAAQVHCHHQPGSCPCPASLAALAFLSEILITAL